MESYGAGRDDRSRIGLPTPVGLPYEHERFLRFCELHADGSTAVPA
jgi:hypothetical protein